MMVTITMLLLFLVICISHPNTRFILSHTIRTTERLNWSVVFLQRGALYVVCKPPRPSSCNMAAAVPWRSEGASSRSLSRGCPPLRSVPPASYCLWPSAPPRPTACRTATPTPVTASTVPTDSIWPSLSCQTGEYTESPSNAGKQNVLVLVTDKLFHVFSFSAF